MSQNKKLQLNKITQMFNYLTNRVEKAEQAEQASLNLVCKMIENYK